MPASGPRSRSDSSPLALELRSPQLFKPLIILTLAQLERLRVGLGECIAVAFQDCAKIACLIGDAGHGSSPMPSSDPWRLKVHGAILKISDRRIQD
jgi:hypothetical protein